MNKMEELEICRLYREAKYQKMQERILADMYLCTVADIKEILERNGVYNQNGKVKGARNVKGRPRGSHFTKRKVAV